MYISAEGAKVQAQRLEFIANNLANVETPGFKRDVPTFQARFSEAIQQGHDYPGSKSGNDIGGGVKLVEVDTDFSNATLRQTNIKTDFAVHGEGFFQVRTPDGEMLLTRAGDFEIDSQGRLVTQTGRYQVLDEAGGGISLDATKPWTVQRGGVITQEGQNTPMGLQQPASLGDLVKVGNNAFRPLGPISTVPAEDRDIRQGFLEMSGVSSTSEMMTMIETSRAFEANTKLIQHQDSMLSNLLSRVLTA
ncbi:MAG: flagellar hook-basal body protein [Planctomycetes bacterium]|nr:flagellar hook-basal body protein [Planctomycetota bacterium]